MQRQRTSFYVVIGLVCFLLGGLAVSVLIKQPLLADVAQPDSLVQNYDSIDDSPRTSVPLWSDTFANIAEQVSPAVVYISTEFPEEQRQQSIFDNFWMPFFSIPELKTQRAPRLGTGFIINDEGYILTNQHVVGDKGDKQTITVTLSTPEFQGQLPAVLVGSDWTLDLAVIKIEKPEALDKLPSIPLGDSSDTRQGDWVMAIGNPYGDALDHTLTVGVISAKGRSIQIQDTETNKVRTYRELMQTDASINPGNSGGPLINVWGEVIGINTAIHSAAQGIGFAIPVNKAKDVLDMLITDGKVTRAWLGVTLVNITQEIADWASLTDTDGVMVFDVVRGSPAAKAGLQVYDIIRRIDDIPITSDQDLVDTIAKMKPGDKIMVAIVRQGKGMLIPVTLEETQ
ncbi:MAG: trypsin-like peptidase domain-containing protein [Limnochordia bacterium]|nr:trypsin-like peptidase domain-containing protein [Limnochordia bacterium]